MKRVEGSGLRGENEGLGYSEGTYSEGTYSEGKVVYYSCA